MGQFFSTFFDPLGFGFGEAVFGKPSAIVNLSGSDKKKKGGAGQAPEQPKVPAPGESLEQAQVDAQNKRRGAILSGGDTQVSNFGYNIPSTSLDVHALLGE